MRDRKLVTNTAAETITGFAEKDQRVLELVYKENYPTVLQYVLKNNGKESDAKDIFQEAILAAWLNVTDGKFSTESAGSLGGYIFQIAKFKWLDKLKSKVHRSTVRLVREDQADHSLGDMEELDIQEQRMKAMKEMYEELGENADLS